MYDIWYNNRVRGKDDKPYTGIALKRIELRPSFFDLRRMESAGTTVLPAPSVFSKKGNPMTTKRTQGKSREKQPKLSPIVVVPDKSYIDDTGNIIPTGVLLIADATLYGRMIKVLEAWGKEVMGVPSQRGIIEG